MLLAIDIGNSNIKYAIYDGGECRISFRVSTDLKRTSDEYGAQLIEMLHINHISVKEIRGGIISSVVPSV